MSNNIIDFTQLGGYRLEQPTFEKMQSTYFGILAALMGHLNVLDTGNYILSGCEIVGANINPGIMYIDGALCPFAGGAGIPTTKIKRQNTINTLSFENGTNPAVFTSTSAVIDASGVAYNAFVRVNYSNVVPWSNLTGIPTDIVQDAAYVHTDENFTALLLAKLIGIQPFAEVNVQSDFAETDVTSDSFIKNRPVGNLLTYLKQGTYIHGDLITNSQAITISFSDIGTSAYKVIGNIVGSGSSAANDARINYVTKDHTSTSFKLVMNDGVDAAGQSVKFTWILTPDLTS